MNRVTKRIVKNFSNVVLSEESFTYDAAGNVTDALDSCFAYDTNNRLISFNENTVSYDLDGNMLSNGSLTCTYDSANRLVSAGAHTYTYNAEDVRIRNLCIDEDTIYTYDTNCKLSKLLTKTTGGVTTKYVYGRGLIGEETNSSFKTYHFDFRGSTIAITDENGTITDTFAYDTYGKLLSRTGITPIIFGYNGKDGVVTDDNGLIYMRARYYSPEMKRFINADIVAGKMSNAITLNRFAYANGNPVSFVDPFGLSAEKYQEAKKVTRFLNDYLTMVTDDFIGNHKEQFFSRFSASGTFYEEKYTVGNVTYTVSVKAVFGEGDVNVVSISEQQVKTFNSISLNQGMLTCDEDGNYSYSMDIFNSSNFSISGSIGAEGVSLGAEYVISEKIDDMTVTTTVSVEYNLNNHNNGNSNSKNNGSDNKGKNEEENSSNQYITKAYYAGMTILSVVYLGLAVADTLYTGNVGNEVDAFQKFVYYGDQLIKSPT